MTPEENAFLSMLYRDVEVGDGAIMTIPHGEIVWQLTYGKPERVKYQAGSLIESYRYLLSGHITTKEAIRRLRLMRAAYAAPAEKKDQTT